MKHTRNQASGGNTCIALMPDPFNSASRLSIGHPKIEKWKCIKISLSDCVCGIPTLKYVHPLCTYLCIVHVVRNACGKQELKLIFCVCVQVESSQNMIRIVGLSATLPNYLDVARFLRVNPYQGLFFFDGRFRPVPLSQTFIGIKARNRMKQLKDMEEVCYEKVLTNVQKGYQVNEPMYIRI